MWSCAASEATQQKKRMVEENAEELYIRRRKPQQGKKAMGKGRLDTTEANKDTLHHDARLRKGKDKAIIRLHHNSCHSTTLASSQGSGTTGNEGNQKARAKGPDQSFRKRGVASIGQEGGACTDV